MVQTKLSLRSAMVCAAGFALILLPGCETAPSSPAPTTVEPVTAPTPPPPRRVPVDMSSTGSKPIAFQRLIFNMEPGAVIGKVYWGPMKIEKDTLKAPSLSVGSEQFALIARDEMRKCNYTMLGGENLIFGSDESSKARHQLGAQVTSMKMNIYGSTDFWAGKTTVRVESAMSIDWQVYDTFARKVVYTHSTHVDAQTDGDSEQEMFLLFRKNLHELLAENSFVTFMQPDTPANQKPDQNAASTFPVLSLKINTGSRYSLPADFAKLLDSVVTIKPGAGRGSGFIITSDGYVLTAAHVVSSLKIVPVQLNSGLILDAEIARIDEGADIALLKLPGNSHKPLEIAKETPGVGVDIYAVGSPVLEELHSSVSKGVISGNREIGGHKFLQTDVSANPGNSGGPLLDNSGRAVAVVSWKVAAVGYEGLAFAVPLSETMRCLNLVFDEGTNNTPAH